MFENPITGVGSGNFQTAEVPARSAEADIILPAFMATKSQAIESRNLDGARELAYLTTR
jgi:hypothetical protein